MLVKGFFCSVSGSLDSQAPPTSAAGQPGGGVQDAVAQGLRLGHGEPALQREAAEPGQPGAPFADMHG
jgi:hypothetical protein